MVKYWWETQVYELLITIHVISTVFVQEIRRGTGHEKLSRGQGMD